MPHGSVVKAVLPPGRFYPGSPHTYAVYVPAQYDGKTPLPYTVWLDGSNFLGGDIGVPAVLDKLIAEHAIPPMAGIFVDPGVLPAIAPDRQNRYERSFEYDSLSRRYSDFVVQELVPAVAAKYRLSDKPDDHAMAGISTGAIASFLVAWNRPDQFHRVLSFIGTYVAMRGGDTVPELVRKTEARPLRVWLEGGDADHLTAAEPYGTFYAGSWPRANQVMNDALQFQGYDAKLTVGPGGHDMRLGAQLLPDALRWLWRGYPQPLAVHPPAALNGPGWDTRGSIWATVDAVNDWQPAGTDAVSPNSKEATSPSGTTYRVAEGDRRIAIAGRGGAPIRFIDTGLKQPAGLAFSPDGAMLVVADRDSRQSWSFQLDREGMPTHGEPFYRLETEDAAFDGATGAAIDSLGQVYFATAVGVQICEASGRVAMILNRPDTSTDAPIDTVAFGGEGLQWLYVTQAGKLYRRHLKTHGVPASSPQKPPLPPL